MFRLEAAKESARLTLAFNPCFIIPGKLQPANYFQILVGLFDVASLMEQYSINAVICREL
jgi:hypothetical protein